MGFKRTIKNRLSGAKGRLRREGRRLASVLLCASLVAGNLYADPLFAQADSTEEDYLYEIEREALQEALAEAVSEGQTVSEDMEFYGEFAEEYAQILKADGALYELEPEFEKDRGRDKDMGLQVFARVKGSIGVDEEYEIDGSEEIIFLLTNKTNETVSAEIVVGNLETGAFSILPEDSFGVEVNETASAAGNAAVHAGSGSGSGAGGGSGRGFSSGGTVSAANETPVTGADDIEENADDTDTASGKESAETYEIVITEDNEEGESDETVEEADVYIVDKPEEEAADTADTKESNNANAGEDEEAASGENDVVNNSGDYTADSDIQNSDEENAEDTGNAENSSSYQDDQEDANNSEEAEDNSSKDSDGAVDEDNKNAEDADISEDSEVSVSLSSVSFHQTQLLTAGKATSSDAETASASDASPSDADRQIDGIWYDSVWYNRKGAAAFVTTAADLWLDTNQSGQKTLGYEGKDYSVELNYGLDARLPKNVELIADEYEKDSETYQERYAEAAALYGWDEDAENDFRLFNIGPYADGEEVEPAAEVDVTISYMEKDDLTEYNVIHYGDEDTEIMDAVSDYEDGMQSISFSTDGFSDFGILLASEENGDDTNRSYVNALVIKSTIDGTAPFDDDDETGNDSNESNGVVRTFDYVNYTLEYTTSLMDTTVTVDSAYMMVSFELDCDPSVAEFNTDTLNWCLDQVITYTYNDDSTSTTWDSSKIVTKQVLTGKRYLSQDESGKNAIPGVGTLSVGIYVKAAKNGDTLQPIFTVWMEGNEDGLRKSVTGNEITVTAEPRYNIYLLRNGSCDYLGYWDFDKGTVSSSRTDNSEIYGRVEGYGIVIQLYNTSEDKGLKGIELPAGEISFTVTFTAILDGVDVTSDNNYKPLLWDYVENTPSSTTKVGKLGRPMCYGNINNTSYAIGVPGNSGGTANKCYESGTWIVEQTGNVLSVTISGYEFDQENFDFPTRGLGDNTTTTRYGNNIGCFSAGYIHMLASYPDTVSTTSTYRFIAEAAEMKASSISGQTAVTEALTSDNSSSIALALYAQGNIGKSQWYYSSTGTSSLASNYAYGDAYSYQGAEITILSRASFTGDGTYTSFNLLQKFDNEALEVVPTDETGYLWYDKGQSLSEIDSITVLYAAKPGGTLIRK